MSGHEDCAIEARRALPPHSPPDSEILSSRSGADPAEVFRELWQEQQAANARQNRLIAQVVHELRNPLAPISTAVQLLRMEPSDNLVRNEALEILQHEVGRLSELVEDLFQASRITTGQFEMRKELVDVRAVVKRAVDDARPLISGRGRELLTSLPDGPLHVQGEARRLEQVVVNLLHNALKYTSTGGCIWAELVGVSGQAVLRIRDSGRGIAPELLPSIFDCFAQGDQDLSDSGSGMGVGLALVKQFVELHGGTVRASSAGPGCGADFVVTLPAVVSD